jgi:hypothetical protein
VVPARHVGQIEHLQRVLINAELTAMIGAALHERTPDRQRNATAAACGR